MKLLTVDNDTKGLLTTVLKEVEKPEKMTKKLEKMVKVMEKHEGIGLTANQVGLTERMFVFTLNDGTVEFAVNPEILVKFKGSDSLTSKS